MPRMLGRKTRRFKPKLNLSTYFAAQKLLPPIPQNVNYGANVTNWGMMLNDQLGDCTCAAFYHARQSWTQIAQGVEDTQPDHIVEQLYEEAAGYVPGDPSTDNGAVEQDLLKYLQNTGAPIQAGARDKILGSAEINVRNLDDIRRAIYIGGGVYIGFSVPQYIMDQPQNVFAVNPSGDQTIAGGHAIWVYGYNSLKRLKSVSWGDQWIMTWGFWQKYVDEAYLIGDLCWIEATGHTPVNMTTAEYLAYLKSSV